MKFQHYFFLLMFTLIGLNACEEKRESQIHPYMAKVQPRFYFNNQIEHLKRDNKVVERIALIGDAGDAVEHPETLDMMKKIAKRLNGLDTKETLVFLGDNIYEKGYQGDNLKCGNNSPEAQSLEAQLYLGKAPLKTNPSYFIPGNHDWDYHKTPDMKLMMKEKNYLEKCGRETHFVPSQNDKPALVSALEETNYTMIFLDSQSIMRSTKAEQDQAYSMIEGIFKLADPNKLIVIAAHHPLATHGPHGGCYQQDYFGSSIINFFRRHGISWGQDINAKVYADYISRIKSIIPKANKVIFVSGHDHGLQVLSMKDGPDFQIVSGSGSKTDPVCVAENTLFAQETMGFIEIGFREQGQITVEAFAFRPEKNIMSKVYSQRLF